jgi:hypothetical protein
MSTNAEKTVKTMHKPLVKRCRKEEAIRTISNKT